VDTSGAVLLSVVGATVGPIVSVAVNPTKGEVVETVESTSVVVDGTVD
jgi:hypothetical protein